VPEKVNIGGGAGVAGEALPHEPQEHRRVVHERDTHPAEKHEEDDEDSRRGRNRVLSNQNVVDYVAVQPALCR